MHILDASAIMSICDQSGAGWLTDGVPESP